MKKRLLIVVAVAVFALVAIIGFNLLTPGAARAQTTDDCAFPQPTIDSLTTCVKQCAQQGFINNQGVANSLLAKLNAAQVAQDRGQSSVAISDLQAFIHEVQAQAGKHIEAQHAQHMVMHAQSVINILGG